MANPPKSVGTPNLPPRASTSLVKRVEQLGGTGYLNELPHSPPALGALEGLHAASLGVVMSMDSDAPQTTTIIKKDGAYYVYFHVSELNAAWWGVNLGSFSQWAMSLTELDTIYLFETGNVYYLPMVIQILNVFDTQCKAKKVFVVDHMIDTPLFLLVCDDMCLEDTGAITFRHCVDLDTNSRAERVFLPYLRKLYDRAVARKLLTAEEARAVLEENRIVFKTARELKAQITTA